MQNSTPLIIGIAGFGTVGSGVIRTLAESSKLIEQRIGRPIIIKSVLIRDKNKPRPCALPSTASFVYDIYSLTDDPEIEVIIELMGGIESANALISRAFDMGKHVITANKALLAEASTNLFQKAKEKGLWLLYEASVTGAIPIVQTLKESLAGNNISSLIGILNGTSNYILSQMSTEGLDFATALQQATELGYAEADPTLDIDGFDAAHKLVLLIRLAYGVEYPYTEMPIFGIRNMNQLDIAIAREFGYRIKLLAQARLINDTIEAGIFPTLIHHRFLMSSVGGAYNAVRVEGNAVGSLFLHGRGAGDMPTASSVIGDLITIARNTTPNNTGFINQVLDRAQILHPNESISPYYLRFMVNDSSGVLRDISGILAAQDISIAQVIQKPEEQGSVPLIFMTHEAKSISMQLALKGVMEEQILKAPPVCYRVLQ